MKATKTKETINVPATIYEWASDNNPVRSRLEVLEFGEYFYYRDGELCEHGLFDHIDHAEILGVWYDVYVEDSERLFIAFGYNEENGRMIRPGRKLLASAGVLEAYQHENPEDIED